MTDAPQDNKLHVYSLHEDRLVLILHQGVKVISHSITDSSYHSSLSDTAPILHVPLG